MGIYDRNSKKLQILPGLEGNRPREDPHQGTIPSHQHSMKGVSEFRTLPKFFLVADNISSVPTVDVRGARTKGTVVDIFTLSKSTLSTFQRVIRERVGNIST